MRIQTTAVLLGLVILLGGMIWWTDRTPEGGGGGVDGGANVMVRFDPEAIDSISLKGANGEATLEKNEGAWVFTEPVSDRADPNAVDALIDLLGHLTVLDEITGDELESGAELSSASLGLTGDSVVQVELGDRDGGTDSQVILIGNPTPLANSIYARLSDSGDAEGAFVVNGNPRKYLEDPVAVLRDRNLIRTPADRIVQVVVKTPVGEIDVRRKITPPVAGWTLMKPLQTRANRELLEGLLTSLVSMRFESITGTGDLPGPPPNPVPEGSVVLELVSFGSETPLTIYLKPAEATAGSQDSSIEATVSDRPAVFKLRSELLTALPDSPDAFRDRHLAQIPPNLVFGIEIQTRGYAPVDLKTGKARDGSVRWFSVRNGKEELANQSRILGLINGLNETRVLDFVSDSAAKLAEFNLDPPAQQIAFGLYEIQPETAPDGAPAADGGKVGVTKKVLQLGSSDDGKALFANFVGEPYIYEIGPEFLQKFYGDPLRWKSRQVISFNEINLREIRRTIPGEPELRLKYDYRRDSWDVFQGESEENLAGRLDRVRASQLRSTLGSLTAVDWNTSPEVFEVLREPAVSFTIVTDEVDQATGKVGPVEHVLRFAPRAPGVGIFFGAMDDSPDLFQVDRETYRDLIVPLLLREPKIGE